MSGGDKAFLVFRIMGKFKDPSVITKHLGIRPTDVSIQGNPITGGGPDSPKIKRSSWEVRFSVTPDQEMEKFALKIVNKIAKAKLLSLRKKIGFYDVGLSCVVYLESRMPTIFFSEKTVSKLHERGMYINIDVMQIAD